MSSLLPAAAPAVPDATPGDPLAPVLAAFEQLPEGTAPGLSCIGAIKNAWVRARAAAALVNRTSGGRSAGVLLADFADRLMTVIFNVALRRAGWHCPQTVQAAQPAPPPPRLDDRTAGGIQGVAILALGSYARRELAPFSDLDVLLLRAEAIPDARLEALAGYLLRPLWDAGLQVGHAVRSRQECVRAMEEVGSGAHALETVTAMLEARFVAGDRVFASAFYDEDLSDFFHRFGSVFMEAKHEETLARWQGQSVYHTQPHLKDSPGAMRDFQLAAWVDRASQLSGHLPRLNDRPLVSRAAIEEAEAGYERLLTFRVSLHTLCNRRQDVLDFAMQQAVADDLAYEGGGELRAPERLLQAYFGAATAVYRLAHTVTRRYQEERAIAAQDEERLRRREVDEDFTRVGDYLYASHAGVFSGPDWVEPAFRVFVHATQLGLDISQDAAEAIRARVPEMNDSLRCHHGAAAFFTAILRARNHVARTLRLMRDIGLLGAYIPEFGEVEGLAINDVFHDYTVDEHTLCLIETVDRLYQSGDPATRFQQEILGELPRPYLLRLAGLMHDLGKSRGGGGHSERGALMVPAIGERLGLSGADVRTLIFLVEEHLTLSKVSQRRDPGEGGLLNTLARQIGTKERLDLLYLLSYCDAVSVGHGAFPAWKDALLAELYHGILAQLPAPGSAEAASAPAAAPSASAAAAEANELEAALLAWARDDADRALALEHCRSVPPRYLVEVSADEAVLHLETIKRMRANGREAVAAVHPSGGLMGMWVVSTDRPRRFSQICGSFLGFGVNIISAIAYTRSDGIILDHFRVAPGPDVPQADAFFWQRLAASVEDTLAGTPPLSPPCQGGEWGGGDFQKRIEAARRRIPFTPRITLQIEPEVRVDNKLSDTYTVVDVFCGDRIGLLYGLSRALGDLSCDIHFAKIATTQGVVTDVFYITEVGGGQVTDPEKMLNIRRLLKAVAADFQEAKR